MASNKVIKDPSQMASATPVAGQPDVQPTGKLVGPGITPALVDPTPAQGQQAPPPGQLGAGTGFVNIDRVLGANTGAGKQAFDAADTARSGARKEFGTALARHQSDRDYAASDSSLGAGDLSWSSDDPYRTKIDKGLTDGTLKNATKTMEIGDVGGGWDSENSRRADALSNTKTAGRQLAADAGLSAQYGGKLSSIDAAIYGSAPNKTSLDLAAQLNTQEKTGEAGQAKSENDATHKQIATSKALAGTNTAALTRDAQGYGADTRQGSALAGILGDSNLVFGAAGSTPINIGAGQHGTSTAPGTSSLTLGTPDTPQSRLNSSTPMSAQNASGGGEGSDVEANALGTDEILRRQRQGGRIP